MKVIFLLQMHFLNAQHDINPTPNLLNSNRTEIHTKEKKTTYIYHVKFDALNTHLFMIKNNKKIF